MPRYELFPTKEKRERNRFGLVLLNREKCFEYKFKSRSICSAGSHRKLRNRTDECFQMLSMMGIRWGWFASYVTLVSFERARTRLIRKWRHHFMGNGGEDLRWVDRRGREEGGFEERGGFGRGEC